MAYPKIKKVFCGYSRGGARAAVKFFKSQREKRGVKKSAVLREISAASL